MVGPGPARGKGEIPERRRSAARTAAASVSLDRPLAPALTAGSRRQRTSIALAQITRPGVSSRAT